MNTNTLYAVEYSIIQGAFNIAPLHEITNINQHLVIRGINNGYVVIGIFDDYDDGSEFIRQWKSKILAR
jgi:hypothetical protein